MITFSICEIADFWFAVAQNHTREIYAASFSPSKKAVLRQITKSIPPTLKTKRDDSTGYAELEILGKLFLGKEVERIPKINLTYASDFQRAVYTMLSRIRKGRVSTYSMLAHAVGCESGYRAIGRALASNRHPLLIPCHRIICSSLEIGGYSVPGLRKREANQLKRRILTDEGVGFADGRVTADYLSDFAH